MTLIDPSHPRAADMTPAASGYRSPVGMDALTREKFAEFQGRDPHVSGAGKMCMHIKQPNFPQYRFEWHPQAKKVYLIRVGSTPLIGEIIAEHADSEGAAINFVQTFLRGFREGQTPTIAKTHLEG